MNYIGISDFDTANGPGVRVSLFVSGCRLRCRGCFNPESWDFDAGKPYDESVQERILKSLEEDYVDGLSLLGVIPWTPRMSTCLRTCAVPCVKSSETKTIWLWTGRLYDKVKDLEIFQYVDTVVDGPFIEKYKVEGKGNWFGSSNQRVIPIRCEVAA